MERALQVADLWAKKEVYTEEEVGRLKESTLQVFCLLSFVFSLSCSLCVCLVFCLGFVLFLSCQVLWMFLSFVLSRVVLSCLVCSCVVLVLSCLVCLVVPCRAVSCHLSCVCFVLSFVL